ELWKQPLADWIGSSPCYDASRQRVYVGLEFSNADRQGAMVALEPSSGEILWSFQTPALQHGSAACASALDAVVFGSNDGSCFAVAAQTGDLLWKSQVGSAVKGTPAVDSNQGVAVFGTTSGEVFVVDLSDGTIKHTWITKGEVFGQPLIVADRCFIASGDKSLYV